MTIEVRQAGLDDAAAISGLFRARIPVWQRLDARGRVETVPYDRLTIYERWLHGGAWMSIETSAIFLNHLLRGAGLPLVALRDGVVAAYAEAYFSHEPEPYHHVLHIAQCALPDDGDDAIEDALIDGLAARAKAARCAQITIARSEPFSVAVERRYRLHSVACQTRFSLPARQGQVFYKATEQADPDPARVQGWQMSIGRTSCSRQHWETLMPHLWDALPEMRDLQRQHFAVAGQDAYLVVEPQLYDPRSAYLYCWTAKALTPQLVTAIRDWAHRAGYRSLIAFVPDQAAAALAPDAEPDGVRHEVVGFRPT